MSPMVMPWIDHARKIHPVLAGPDELKAGLPDFARRLVAATDQLGPLPKVDLTKMDRQSQVRYLTKLNHYMDLHYGITGSVIHLMLARLEPALQKHFGNPDAPDQLSEKFIEYLDASTDARERIERFYTQFRVPTRVAIDQTMHELAGRSGGEQFLEVAEWVVEQFKHGEESQRGGQEIFHLQSLRIDLATQMTNGLVTLRKLTAAVPEVLAQHDLGKFPDIAANPLDLIVNSTFLHDLPKMEGTRVAAADAYLSGCTSDCYPDSTGRPLATAPHADLFVSHYRGNATRFSLGHSGRVWYDTGKFGIYIDRQGRGIQVSPNVDWKSVTSPTFHREGGTWPIAELPINSGRHCAGVFMGGLRYWARLASSYLSSPHLLGKLTQELSGTVPNRQVSVVPPPPLPVTVRSLELR